MLGFNDLCIFMESGSLHRAAFITIVGKPNAGKSSLLNAILGEKLVIVTPKAQTTRHRIKGILNEPDLQLVFSDTPGVLKPEYLLQERMMLSVSESLEDADLVIYLMDAGEKGPDEHLISMLRKAESPLWLVINKVDLHPDLSGSETPDQWKSMSGAEKVFCISALLNDGVPALLEEIKQTAPVHPPFFDKEDMTDRSERFVAEEIIREKILMNYKKEVPYAVEVKIESFKESEEIIHIEAIIYIERSSQKSIIIGTGGERLKKVGTEARADMERFFGKKVFLSTYVKLKENWRKDERMLNYFGYKE